MLVVMDRDATEADVQAVCKAIERMGFQPLPMPLLPRLLIRLLRLPQAACRSALA